MIETNKLLEGVLQDQGNFDVLQAKLDEALTEITNARGVGGITEIRIRWYSDDEWNRIVALTPDQKGGRE